MAKPKSQIGEIVSLSSTKELVYMRKKFPFYLQLDAMDCGATCLRMIAKHYGKEISITKLRDRCFTNREGVSLLEISDAAESIGLHTLCARLSFENLAKEAPLPCIVHWRERHFLIVYAVKKNIVYVSDPAHGLVTYSIEEFKKAWISSGNNEEPEGFALFLEPRADFYEEEEESRTSSRVIGSKYYLSYLRPYRKYYIQLGLSLLVATVIQIILPFLTQSMVDVGVNNQDLSFVYVVLLAQIVLLLSGKAGEFMRSWLLLHMTSRISISILSDFLIKLMKLPISFFDRKTPGDIMQRIYDHDRIQGFFTSTMIEFLFTIINFFVFGTILAFYNIQIFLIYLGFSFAYFGWIWFFLRKRKELDYKNYDQNVANHNNTLQLVTGMQEIKMQNCERQKRWEWERIQARFFKLSIQRLSLSQIEGTGAVVLMELRNIFLTFFAASLVIEGQMTLGMMLAIQYIAGQLNGITWSVINFVHVAQDAMVSIERLSEIHAKDDEEIKQSFASTPLTDDMRDIVIDKISFQYGGPRSKYVLKDLSLTIPKGKVTAIVGSSGSGKTTILKLLLKSYEPTEGTINYGETNIRNISFKNWRSKFACVMQESYMFSDTIAKNIAVGEEVINKERLKYATVAANIREFIEGLPLEYNTKIGDNGIGVSQGQRQRLFIARAVYKNSDILLLDEATNALDANNEKVIINHLNEYFQGKTVVVVAHRLSTVKNADQIVVLDEGQIVEIGTHEELVSAQGPYYNLVKNQLDLN